MRYAVLIKQVPDVSQMQFDPETRRLRREGVRSEVSALDIRALIRALELRAETGGEVVVLTMGPPQARDALVHCLALGADRGVHLVDPAFAGADTLATARALTAALRREPFDLVLCGRSSIDAETGQVGPEIAELLDWVQLTAARRLEIDVGRRRVKAERETDDGYESVECALPALLSAAEDIAPERFPKRAEKEAAKSKPIAEVRAAELDSDVSRFGVAGSPTRVGEIRAIEVSRDAKIIEAEPAAAVRQLVELLVARDAFAPASKTSAAVPSTSAATGDPSKAIWVVAEVAGGRPRTVSFELLGQASTLSRQSGGEVAAVLLGHGVLGLANELAASGASRVFVCDDPLLEDYSTDAYAAVLARAIEMHRPRSVLLPATWRGRDLAPRVAARLGLGLTGDAIDLSLDEKGRLVQWKPAFGGTIVAPILSSAFPEMATVRPGMFERAPRDTTRSAAIEVLRLAEPPAIRTLVTARTPLPGHADANALDEYASVIGVGMGVGGVEGLRLLEPLARSLGGAPFAATRDVTDAGWLPRQLQVGLTGRVISPRLYFAIGIRGAFEHMVGVRKSGTIVSINKNPKAAVFAQSDFGLVGEWETIVPLLAETIRGITRRS